MGIDGFETEECRDIIDFQAGRRLIRADVDERIKFRQHKVSHRNHFHASTIDCEKVASRTVEKSCGNISSLSLEICSPMLAVVSG